MNEVCTCKHFGGSTPDSLNDHDPRIQKGHGACRIWTCECKQFTWDYSMPIPKEVDGE